MAISSWRSFALSWTADSVESSLAVELDSSWEVLLQAEENKRNESTNILMV